MEDVESVALALTEMRCDPSVFEEIYKNTEDMCSKLDIDIPVPKRRKTSVLLKDDPGTADSNSAYHATTKKEEVRLFTYYSVLDVLVQSLNERFSQETKSVISAVAKIITLNLGQYKYDNDDLMTLSKHFGIDADELKSELSLLKTIKRENFPPKKVQDWLLWLSDEHRSAKYNNFKLIIKKFVSIPVTSCSCERGFSKLSSLKTKLRNTMKQERLENLLLPYMEQTLCSNINTKEVIDVFKSMVPYDRRLSL